MRKVIRISKGVFVMIVFMLVFIPSGTYSADVCKGITIETLRRHVPIPPAEIISMRPVHGLCEIILDINGEYTPVYATRDFVIAGELFEDKTQVTQEKISELKARQFAKLKGQVENVVAISYRPSKNPQHTIYMFTDPVCPFCGRAESQIKGIADKFNAEIKIIFFPVHIPVGRDKAIEAVCRKLTLEQYLKKDWEKENKTDKYQCEKGKKLLQESYTLARKLGIRGVPTFFVEGKRIIGANMPRLKQALTSSGS